MNDNGILKSMPVQQVRVTMDGPVYDVRAYDMFGQLVRHRRYSYGSRRREWANEQARQWAKRYYLYFEEE